MQSYWFFGILVMAFVSYLPRVLPILFIRKKIESQFIRSFLYYVPFAVLAAMIFPQILYATDSMLASVVGCIVAVLAAYMGGGLIVAAVCSVLAVLLMSFL